MDEVVASFNRSVAALPQELQAKVCPTRSHRINGKWTLLNTDGDAVLPDRTKDIAEKPKPEYMAARVATLEKSLEQSKKLQVVMTEAFEAIGARLKQHDEAIAKFAENMNGEVAQREEIRRTLEERGRGIVFKGEWQQAAEYSVGSMVTYRDKAYVAVRKLSPGGSNPNRQGAGWTPLFDSTEIQDGSSAD